MEAIKLCRLDTPIIFIEARINLSRFVVTGCAAKTSDRKSGSAGMPRPISYAVFCLKKKNQLHVGRDLKPGGLAIQQRFHPLCVDERDVVLGGGGRRPGV